LRSQEPSILADSRSCGSTGFLHNTLKKSLPVLIIIKYDRLLTGSKKEKTGIAESWKRRHRARDRISREEEWDQA
jgi:hypothetical protein